MFSFTANQAKTQFGELLAKAQREPISITKNGKPSVVVMSIEDYQAYEELKLQQLRDRLAHSIAQAEAGHVHDGDKVFDELMKDL
ncbi:prevent-host-death family protein [Enterobacter sp. BIGb0383]|uniref:type II toxin-antitoxin system Phd/YefM family antitoxin n=1 Tax=unclassified Enterobacter TaxID=2608935 RepID=UPI000F48E8D1|nr:MULTISPECIES: type II toxin-antitoxin system Phd/YefM family antitoxin [unclassified Enterobacter]ROP50080.1 prevent-host-death family protein [Enterobacter sp. BIGb0383]ROS06177.1 prevent-host-death family protein [Enterobacter sp. BIGb0359]